MEARPENMRVRHTVLESYIARVAAVGNVSGVRGQAGAVENPSSGGHCLVTDGALTSDVLGGARRSHGP